MSDSERGFGFLTHYRIPTQWEVDVLPFQCITSFFYCGNIFRLNLLPIQIKQLEYTEILFPSLSKKQKITFKILDLKKKKRKEKLL